MRISVVFLQWAAALKVVSAILGRNINDHIHHRQGVGFGVFHPVKTIMNAAQHHTTPTPCSDWLEDYLFWFGVAGSTICVLSRSTGCVQRRVFWRPAAGGLWWKRSDEWDHLYFGLESLIQPLSKSQPNTPVILTSPYLTHTQRIQKVSCVRLNTDCSMSPLWFCPIQNRSVDAVNRQPAWCM